MPRISYEQATQVVRDVITNAGGEITHADLVQQLNTSGNQVVVNMLQGLANNRVIVAHVRAVDASSKAQLVYTLGGE